MVRTLVVTGIALGSLLACIGPSSAIAKPDNPTNEARLDSTVRYLQDVQQPDGGFGNAGEEPSQDFSAWVAFALAAAGINPRDQAQPKGVDAYDFLVEHFKKGIAEELCAPVVCTTTFERELLVVETAGTDPHDFAGYDLIGEILARKLPDGSFPFVPGGSGEVNDTVWAILALSSVNEQAVREAVHHAAEWLIGQQESDGSWSWKNKNSQGEVDTTGAAIEALNAAGMHDTVAQEKAFEYLHEAQEPDGGFPEFPGKGEEANVASTAWATQGIWSAGQNPETWKTSTGAEPLRYMASLQQPDGHIKWGVNKEMNGVWMTAMVTPTFAGGYFPYSEVPYVSPTTAVPPGSEAGPIPPSPGSAEPGLGGESAQAGSGVIAGGGGDGAPLFSRPQPQSKGKRPGGPQQPHAAHPRHTKKHDTAHRNPGVRRNTTASSATTRISEPNGNHNGPGAGSARKGAGAAASGAGTSTATSSGQKGNGAGSAPAGGGTGSGGSGSGGTPLAAGTAGATALAGGHEVRGILIGTPSMNDIRDALEPGAPGLHSAGAGGNQTPWLAIGIGVAIALLALAGSQFERRRPEVIL
jgi:prenyltransferase beta subunit